MKIALFHPWVKSKGGAERLVLEFLKNTKHDVDVYTWVYDKAKTFSEFEKFNVKVIAPRIAKLLARSYILRSLFFLLALLSKIPLEKYDAFFISTAGIAEFITFRNYKPGKTFAYVYTPLRAAQKEDIEWNLKYRFKNPLIKLFYLFAVQIYKILEKIAWKRMDILMFDSELSLERAARHNLIYGKKVYVVYPLVDAERLSKAKTKKGKFFLYVARFGRAKRQNFLLEAWKIFVRKHPDYKLILVGNLENKNYFKEIQSMAKEIKNIEIRTNVEDKELLKLYANCLAVIFIPFMEDFGLVPFEAMALGKPLIATDRGGYVNLVKKYYKNNVVWIEENENLPLSIARALDEFLGRCKQFKTKKIKVKELTKEEFIKKMENILIKNLNLFR
jgi:glycosyltransferase involved in cell wall biosynthesis